MSASTASAAEAPDAPRAPAARWLAGFTWNGIGLVVALCIVNAVRRTSRDIDAVLSSGPAHLPFTAWLVKTAEAAMLGLVVAVPVALAIVVTYNVPSPRPALRYGALVVAVMASCIAGVALMLAVESATGWEYVEDQSLLDPALVAMVRYGLLCALVAAVFVFLREAEEHGARAKDAERDRARFLQRMEEARLKVLQAQIEPHFLFNTLANVRGLYADSPHDAARMLDNLMEYLAAALPQMRAGDATLGSEVRLTKAYLEVQAIRMGRRLEFAVDVPDALRDVPFPPLMLLTLVENAIKHGLAPLREGGSIRVGAIAGPDGLEIRVADTGGGFTRTHGKGTGLANTRARLAMLHGDKGRLTIGRNAPHGVVATIAIPGPMGAP